MAVLNVNVDFFIIIGETQEVYGLPLYLFDIFNNAEQTKEKDASHAGGVLFLFILIIEFLNTSVREGDILSFPISDHSKLHRKTITYKRSSGEHFENESYEYNRIV
ncbi:hypothetical protein [Bacillus sp. B4EP4a]|uniref:hypothetical protein n=1 Tax=Bacillus sp. B4EP4a TaxID=2590665 RepID=UPI001151B06A|nr:hypothetical protein [Bacillus sp. B4EP4a]